MIWANWPISLKPNMSHVSSVSVVGSVPGVSDGSCAEPVVHGDDLGAKLVVP